MTLASIVEKETARADERPLVAAVYANRLKLGMGLQCDPTVIYALQRGGTFNGNLRRDDLRVDSPYNTYRYPGLPPGPIAAPGKASLEAAANPADVDYLYFVSRNDGSHEFAPDARRAQPQRAEISGSGTSGQRAGRAGGAGTSVAALMSLKSQVSSLKGSLLLRLETSDLQTCMHYRSPHFSFVRRTSK